MARLPSADSASSQFFINLTNNDSLDVPRAASDNAAYAVFGEVVAGMGVWYAIRTPTKNAPCMQATSRCWRV